MAKTPTGLQQLGNTRVHGRGMACARPSTQLRLGGPVWQASHNKGVPGLLASHTGRMCVCAAGYAGSGSCSVDPDVCVTLLFGCTGR